MFVVFMTAKQELGRYSGGSSEGHTGHFPAFKARGLKLGLQKLYFPRRPQETYRH